MEATEEIKIEKRKVGRPPGKLFDRPFQFYLTTEEHEAISEAAEREGTTMSELVRREMRKLLAKRR